MSEPTKEQLGALKRGDPTPGHHRGLVRDFCAGCGEPMRVTTIHQTHYCELCDPPHKGVGNQPPPKTSGLDGDPDAHNKARGR